MSLTPQTSVHILVACLPPRQEFGNNYTNYLDNLDNCCSIHYDWFHPIE